MDGWTREFMGKYMSKDYRIAVCNDLGTYLLSSVFTCAFNMPLNIIRLFYRE